jgi:hypothetical protein
MPSSAHRLAGRKEASCVIGRASRVIEGASLVIGESTRERANFVVDIVNNLIDD